MLTSQAIIASCSVLAVAGQAAELPDGLKEVKTPIQYVQGPTSVDLGPVATLQVPKAFVFLDGQNAAQHLEQRGINKPENLLGVLYPSSRSWLAMLVFQPSGHIKDDPPSVDKNEVLAMLKARYEKENGDRTQKGALKTVRTEWYEEPTYDAATRTLVWGVRAERENEVKSDVVVNLTVRILTRDGMLDIVGVPEVNQKVDNVSSVRDLGNCISIKEGQRYSDYREGDKLSTASLALCMNFETGGIAAPQQAEAPKRAGLLWLIVVAVVCAVGGVAILMARKLSHKKPARDAWQHAEAETETEVEAAAAPVTANGTVTASPTPKSVEKPLAVQSRPRKNAIAAAKAAKAANGKGKKRAFDYNRYFADLMSTVSSHGFPAENNPMARAYGHEVSQLPMVQMPVNGSAVPATDTGKQSELIASQAALIEEQRRLIQEQSKLIEEKSRLIAEKNQLLKLQAELVEHKLL